LIVLIWRALAYSVSADTLLVKGRGRRLVQAKPLPTSGLVREIHVLPSGLVAIMLPPRVAGGPTAIQRLPFHDRLVIAAREGEPAEAHVSPLLLT
jgi:hypothetical protein